MRKSRKGRPGCAIGPNRGRHGRRGGLLGRQARCRPGMAGAGPRRGRAARARLTAPAAAAGAPAAAAASSSSSPGDGGPILLQVAASRASGDG